MSGAAGHVGPVIERATLERFFRREPGLHIYELGDLDPFFFPRCEWWAIGDDPEAVALLYRGTDVTTLLLLSRALAPARALLAEVEPHLPDQLYAHLSPGLVDVLESWTATPHGLHAKMTLADPSRLEGIDTKGIDALGVDDLDEIRALYARSYPGNWFDPRMLETGCYVGAREDGELRSVAGIHVYSPEYRVAALGNITTDPSYRGRGLGRRTVAHLCQRLLENVDTIGLNVKADNATAIRLYAKLGFTHTADYDEVALVRT